MRLEVYLKESKKWYLKTTVEIRPVDDYFNVWTTRSGTQEAKGQWSRSKKLEQTKQQVDKWIAKVKKDSEKVEVKYLKPMKTNKF